VASAFRLRNVIDGLTNLNLAVSTPVCIPMETTCLKNSKQVLGEALF
jgi:hypothetical protein